jgi:two-component system, LytTR family, sensor histidine kinase AlgZ
MTSRLGDWRSWGRVMVACVIAALLVLGFNGAWIQPVPLRRLAFFFGVALVYTVPVGVLLSVGLELLHPLITERPAAVRWSLRIVAMLLLTAAGVVLATIVLLAAGFYSAGDFWPRFWGSYRMAAVIALAIGIAAIISENLRTELDETSLALRTKELEEERGRKLVREAQLASLASRIHPHFLFNTLNTIAALIQEDPAKAERTVGQLAALLRASLDAATDRSVTLANELRLVRDYLDIESARFGDRLQFEVDAPAAVADLHVPPFAIQTLVENAVKHGLSTRSDGGRIQVRVTNPGGDVLIEVADNGERLGSAEFPSGHGLDNLRGRLRSAFGDAATVRLVRDGEWTIASVMLPATSGPA